MTMTWAGCCRGEVQERRDPEPGLVQVMGRQVWQACQQLCPRATSVSQVRVARVCGQAAGGSVGGTLVGGTVVGSDWWRA